MLMCCSSYLVDKVKQIIPQRIRSYITGKIGVWRDDQIVSIAYMVARFIYAKAMGVRSTFLLAFLIVHLDYFCSPYWFW
jgi:hypothetical protein